MDSARSSSRVPEVSLGMPVYNAEAFLTQTIEHLLNQSFGDVEVVISDNASTDATPDICRRFAAQDERVRYSRSAENHGAAWNFNRVLELARGRYFAWTAADDLIAPEFVETCRERLLADPGVVLAMSRAGVIDGGGLPIVGDCDGGARMRTGELLTDEAFANRWSYLGAASAARRYYGVLVLSRRCYELFGLMRIEAVRQTGGLRSYPNAEKVFLAEMSLLGRFAQVPQTQFFSRWYRERFTNNAAADVQNSHWSPRTRRKFVWPHQPACAAGYLLAPFRHRLPLHQRMRCVGRYSQFLLQVRRWPQILAGALRGTGMTVSLPARQEPSAAAATASLAAGELHPSDALSP